MLTGRAESTVREAEMAPISALQHLLYCPRRCALIHIERQWSENRFTAEGRLLHERADGGRADRRAGVRIERSVAVRSRRLGVFGVADVVEVRGDGAPYPVEYKRGRPQENRADEVQLCAQALCLEEMLGLSVFEGALFYGRSRRRRVVVFDRDLRELTERAADEVRRLIDRGDTPAPLYEPQKCEACSLMELCQPKRPVGAGVVGRWLGTQIDH